MIIYLIPITAVEEVKRLSRWLRIQPSTAKHPVRTVIISVLEVLGGKCRIYRDRDEKFRGAHATTR